SFASKRRSARLMRGNPSRRSLSWRLSIEQRPAGRDSLGRYRIATIRGESAGEKQRAVEAWGRQFDRHPDDKATALGYATALRAMAQNAQAAAVLQGVGDQISAGHRGARRLWQGLGRCRPFARGCGRAAARAYARPPELVYPLGARLGCGPARRSR